MCIIYVNIGKPVQKSMNGTVTKIGNVHFYCDNMYIKSDQIQRKNILFVVLVYFSRAKSI